MKRGVVGTLALLSILAGSVAVADPHFAGDRGEWSHRGEREHSARWSHYNDRREDRRDFDRGDHWRYERGRDFDRLGASDRNVHSYVWHGFRRGDRLPVAYYLRPHVIADYRECGLYAPPYGYRWVRVDSDAVLAAVATGIVLDAVYHAF